MFKGASDNAVSRDRNRVLNDTNNYTIDDFWKKSDDLSHEKAALIAEKRDHEAFFAKLRCDLRHDQQMSRTSRSRTNRNVLMNYEKEKLRRLGRIRHIDARLQEIKRENHILNSRYGPNSKLTYADAFYRCAKDLLPHEIVTRIDRAAVAVLAQTDEMPGSERT